METRSDEKRETLCNKYNILDDLMKKRAIISLSIGDIKISGKDIVKFWEEKHNNNLKN